MHWIERIEFQSIIPLHKSLRQTTTEGLNIFLSPELAEHKVSPEGIVKHKELKAFYLLYEQSVDLFFQSEVIQTARSQF